MTASDNNLRLAFAVDAGKFPGMDDQELFDVRQFSVHEEMSGLFAVSVVAVVEEPNIPLQAFVWSRCRFPRADPEQWGREPGARLGRHLLAHVPSSRRRPGDVGVPREHRAGAVADVAAQEQPHLPSTSPRSKS